MIIKRVSIENYDDILELYEKNKEVLSPLDKDKLSMLARAADIFDVVFEGDFLIAYLIAFRKGIEEYDIKSYSWFSERYPEFLYIDSIVVDTNYRNKGFGKMLYQRVMDYARDIGIDTIAAAITKEPYNEASMNLHKEMGFIEVGEQDIRNGTIKLSQQIAEVPLKK